MPFSLQFDTDNAAFTDDDPDVVSPDAVADVLSSLAEGFREDGAIGPGGVLRDANGNKVGTWTFTT